MPFVANESDHVKTITKSCDVEGALQNPPADVVSLDEQRSKGRNKGKSKVALVPDVEATDGPSFELRYALHCEKDAGLKIGGPTGDADGRIDTTPYIWHEDADGSAHWRIQDPRAMESHAHKWLHRFVPNKCKTQYTKSAATTMTTHMIGLGRSHWLPKVNTKLNLVPLRGQYLSLTPEGDIRCLAPDPGFGLTYSIGADFDPSKVKDGLYHPAPVKPDGLFGRYLATTFADDDVRDLAQEAFATVLINHCFEKSIWMYGEGENGKSMMLHLMSAVVGGRSIPISFERLTRDQFGTSSLHGARIATVAEAPKLLTGPMQDIYKQVVSWDALPLERKGKDAITFRPFAVLLVASNDLPKVGQHEHGFWRKVLMIPFIQRVSEANKIQDLHELIIGDSREMAQVIDWLLIGAQRLIKRGGKFAKELPIAVQDLSLRHRLESDTVAGFMDESEAVAEAGVWTSKLGIYTAYRDWCAERGKGALGDSSFWTGARRLFPDYDIQAKQGPIVKGKMRDRFVPLRVQGVESLDPMRWPAGWGNATPPSAAPAPSPAPAPLTFAAPIADSDEWSSEAVDQAVHF